MKTKKKLNIAIVSVTEFSTPPSSESKDIYAPLWLNAYIAQELKRRGHNVTLYASSDSKAKARLVSDGIISLASNPAAGEFYKQVTELKQGELYKSMLDRKGAIELYDFLLFAKMCKDSLEKKFDIVHGSVIGIRPLPFAALAAAPVVLMMHQRMSSFYGLAFSEFQKRYPHIHVIGLSKNQIKPAPRFFTDVVYNGINADIFPFSPSGGQGLLFLGRIVPEKGVTEAMQVAGKTQKALTVLGRKIEDDYWLKEVKPNIGKNIQFKGLVPYGEVFQYYHKSKLLLFPIKWEEPFGLVMVEAMATGTPVVAFAKGSVPEVIQDGKTGFIVNASDDDIRGNWIIKKTGIEGMVEAVNRIYSMPEEEYAAMRQNCREHVENKFTIEKMVDGYEKVYYKILKKHGEKRKK